MKKLTARNKSLILSGLAAVGVVLTGYLSAKCAIKAEEKETTKDKAVAYVPAIVSGAVTVGCIGGSTYFSGEEIAALTVALTAATQRFTDYAKAVHDNVSDEEAARIDEAFYLQEIDRLEQELAEREHPTDEDDLCTFVDSFSRYTFKARLEDVESGIEQAVQEYNDSGLLAWSKVFYYLNNGDMAPAHSFLGGYFDPEWAYGWSRTLIEEMYETPENYNFNITIHKTTNHPNTYIIYYAMAPEACYMAY